VVAPTGGLSRVTIVAPLTRVDLALPSDVALADMLPTLLRYAGDNLADDPAARNGWTLSRLGGVVLDISRSPRQLDVRDGEMLYLRPRGAEAPELAFDDVVDAVATATRERPGRWQPSVTRTVGLTVAVIALLGGATAILFAGPPQLLGGVAALGGAAALLLGAAVLSRAFGQSPTGTVFALVALVYAAVGGLLIGAEDLPLTGLSAPHLLLAAATLLVATAVATVAVGQAAPLFLSTAICVLALLFAAGISFATGAPATSGAAIAVALAFAFLPALPMTAYRLARLPVPSVPTGPDDLKTDTETVDGRRVLEQSERADEYLAALLGSLAVIGAAAGLVLTFAGTAGRLLATAVGLLMVARARWFLSRRQRLPMLIAGLVTLAGVITSIYAGMDHLSRLVAVPGILIVVAAFGFGLAAVQRGRSPRAGRLLDIVEVLLIVAIIPLAFWASGLYEWARSLPTR
jgi:type VII secretion integral membrane protein EccD